MTLHKDVTIANVHIPYAYSYANAAARTGATGFAAGDVGKFARQLDTNAIYMLTATTPTWVQVGGSSVGATDALNSATTVVNVSAATAPTSGQVLTATGGSAATWQTPAGGGSDGFPYHGWGTGRYQNVYQRPGYGTLTGFALTASRVYCGPPMFFHRGANVTAMGIFVHSAAASGKIARLGLYAVGADGYPTTPDFDAGTVLVDATGAREITGLTLLVSADTWYIPALVTDGTPTVSHAPANGYAEAAYGHASISNSLARTHSVFDNVAGSAFGNPFVVDGYLTETSGQTGPIIIWVKQG